MILGFLKLPEVLAGGTSFWGLPVDMALYRISLTCPCNFKRNLLVFETSTKIHRNLIPYNPGMILV